MLTASELKKRIKDKVARAQLGEAIDLCLEHAPHENFKDAAVKLSAKYHQLVRKEKAGTIPPEEARRIRAEITEEIIRLANELDTVEELPTNPLNVSEIIKWPRKRTERLVEITKKLHDKNQFGKIRQKAAFSSFSLPKVEPERNWRLWEECFIPGYDVSGEYYFLLWRERNELEAHARKNGCKLIIYPRIFYFEEASRKIRLGYLLDFISSMDKEGKPVDIVVTESAQRENITIIGELFLTKSHSASTGGFKDTLFNSDPHVLNYHKNEFDHQFDKGVREMIKEYGLPADMNTDYENTVLQARQKSISLLEELAT